MRGNRMLHLTLRDKTDFYSSPWNIKGPALRKLLASPLLSSISYPPTMSSHSTVEVPSLGTTLGALYIGATIATILFGITNTQVVKYYKKYPDDWWIFRYSVGTLWIFDALHVALSTHMLYHYLIGSFGDYDRLYKVIWSFKLQLLVEMFVVVGVQGIYIIRIWKLGRYFHRILPWVVSLTFLVALGNGIFSVYTAYIVSNFKGLPGAQVSIIIISAIPMFSDFVIALSMCYYLHKSRQASGFSKTSGMVLGMMRLGVISGLATSTCSLLMVITYLAWPDTLVFSSIGLILPKLYMNSLLAMLNARKSRANGALPESKATDLPYHNSGNEVTHVSITMERTVSLDHAK
ncbi:hypothetical protein EDD18DRAFT_604573 [Armillaria luteobubalina]|uniref:DUF6534 domain-containing protein n=1 Tax=Armillaria luteobubalina TaxID=153913 RepID=A0AA39QI51_9AGAR|nr:hypothetical protein EDD18DRAFT_604573 [Armillaria luteobubalina]